MNFHKAPVTYINNVTLQVQNLERSLQFYQDVIGFKILSQTEKQAHLTTDGKNALLTLIQPKSPVPKTKRTAGLYHFALLLPTREDLARILRHFANMGIQLGAADHLVSEALYLSDPDGNGIEVYHDRDSKGWTWNGDSVEMATDPLKAEELLAISEGKDWLGLPRDTVMGHIHLHVSDIERSREFYVDGLGFDIVSKISGHALFLSDSSYHHHIAINTWAGVGIPSREVNTPGLISFEVIFPGDEERNARITQLEKMNFEVDKTKKTVIDPSGNIIYLKTHSVII